jgi:hypothetical protein
MSAANAVFGALQHPKDAAGGDLQLASLAREDKQAERATQGKKK